MTPEVGHIAVGSLSRPKKKVFILFLIQLIVVMICISGIAIISESHSDLSPKQRQTLFLTFIAVLLPFLISAIVTFSFKDEQGSFTLTSDKVTLKFGLNVREIALNSVRSCSVKNGMLVFHLEEGKDEKWPTATLPVHPIREYMELYLRFKRTVPPAVWKRFTFDDYYAIKEPHARTIQFFKQGPINCYVDCGWIITHKKTTYFFPFPWPDSFGAQKTGFHPPAGFPQPSEILPRPVSRNLHLLLKAVLVSPIPSYQKESILSDISRHTGGGPIFGPLYPLFRPRTHAPDGIVYIDVPLQWARHVQVKEVELQ